MNIVCSDLEGVFVPEIWINVAEKTGIKELSLTTRDISDYDVLMKKRLSILKDNNLKLDDITRVISSIDPLDGALECINWIRSEAQLIIVSDTFTQFAGPLMKKLNMPTLFCHNLSIGSSGEITGYNLRQDRAKYKTVLALKSINYRVTAFGDSYNDIGMIKEADYGFFFRPPENVKQEFPEFSVTNTYDEVKEKLSFSFEQ